MSRARDNGLSFSSSIADSVLITTGSRERLRVFSVLMLISRNGQGSSRPISRHPFLKRALILCKRLLNYILCIRFFIEVHSIVSASRFFHMPTYLRVVIECQSRFFPFFPAFSRNCPDYFLHTSGSSSFRSLSDLGAR